MDLVLVSPPTVEPVLLEEAKAHLRVLHDAEDELIESLISAARQYAEGYTRRSLVPQTWRLTLDAFPRGPIYLPRPPLIEVVEVAYTDGNGVARTVADFSTILHPARPFIAPAYGAEWPIARDSYGAVTVTYRAGYPVLPEALREAVLLLLGSDYKHRESVITGTIVAELPAAKRRLNMYRVHAVPS